MLRSWTTGLVAAWALLGVVPAVATAADAEVRVLPAAPGLPALVFGTPDGDVCVGVDGDDPTDLDQCGDPSRRDDDAVVVDHLALPDGVLAGMVPAGAPAVRIAFADGARVVVPVSPAPAGLGPVGARLAFFRVRVPVGAGTRAVWGEVLDAAGAVTGVGVLDDAGDGSRIAGRRRVLARRDGRAIYGDARAEQVLEPTVARLDRVVSRACVELGPDVGGPGGDGAPSSCAIGIGPGALVDADVVPTTGCRPDFAGIHGVLPPGSTGAVAVLGDGRRVALRTSSLAPAAPGRLAIAYVPPAAEALRSVELLPRRRRVPLGLAPATVDCADVGYSGSESLYISVRDDPAAPAAQLLGPLTALRATAVGTLLGAEAADGSLCVAVDRTAVDSEDCAPLGRAPGSVVVTRARPRDGRAVVAGVAGPRVAAVRLLLTGVPGDHPSRRIDVPTVPAALDAGGAYAGRLRVFVVSLPGDELPFAPVGLSASGRELPVGPEAVDAFPLPVLGDGSGAPTASGSPERVLRLGRRHGLTAWRVEPGGDGDRCGAVTTGARPTLLELECRDPRVGPSGTVQARCSASGLTVVAVLRGRGARLRATTGTGATRVAARFALGGGDVLHVLTLGRRRSLRALAVTGTPSDGRASAVVPPASTQCGYTSAVQLLGR